MSRNDYYYSHPRSYADSYSSGYPTSVVRRPEKTESIVESSRRDYYPADDYDYHHSPRRSRTSMHRSHSVGDRSAYYGDGSYREGRHRRSRRDRSRHSRSSSTSRRRHRSHHERSSEDRIAQAVKAAVAAGAVEAFRLRDEPGDWAGEKGKRILTAALTAGGTDGFLDRHSSKHDTRHLIESTIAGLAANRLVNGPRSRSRSRSRHGSKSKSRRSSGSGFKEAAAAGLLAAAGKGIYDKSHSRSRSRSRPRSRSRHHGGSKTRGRDRSPSYSSDSDSYSDDSYESPPRKRDSHTRSKSLSDYVSDGLAKLDLGGSDRRSRSRRRHSRRDDDYNDYSDGGRY